MVRAEGLEPPQLALLDPKSSASTSSATPAMKTEIYNIVTYLRKNKWDIEFLDEIVKYIR